MKKDGNIPESLRRITYDGGVLSEGVRGQQKKKDGRRNVILWQVKSITRGDLEKKGDRETKKKKEMCSAKGNYRGNKTTKNIDYTKIERRCH